MLRTRRLAHRVQPRSVRMPFATARRPVGTVGRVHILVMAKEPVPGKVKTRLCPPCTPAEAAEVAAAALADTLEAASRAGADRRILALDGRPGDWLPAGWTVVPQTEGSLNDRLRAAWGAADGPGVQIGMDTPQVTAELLDDALGRIAPGRAQLGLADDGGWWALGLAQPHARSFVGVPMSADNTGRKQRARLESIGLAVELLPSLRDIDHFSDAVAVAAEAPTSATALVVRRLAGRSDQTEVSEPSPSRRADHLRPSHAWRSVVAHSTTRISAANSTSGSDQFV
jgi:glycosyltransferase A (GT-A) superfamily protein (DUF2064 family)